MADLSPGTVLVIGARVIDAHDPAHVLLETAQGRRFTLPAAHLEETAVPAAPPAPQAPPSVQAELHQTAVALERKSQQWADAVQRINDLERQLEQADATIVRLTGITLPPVSSPEQEPTTGIVVDSAPPMPPDVVPGA